MIPSSDAGDGHQQERSVVNDPDERVMAVAIEARAHYDCAAKILRVVEAENVALREALKTAREQEAKAFKIHTPDADLSECFYDQASGPQCASDAHYRLPTYDDWMGHSPWALKDLHERLQTAEAQLKTAEQEREKLLQERARTQATLVEFFGAEWQRYSDDVSDDVFALKQEADNRLRNVQFFEAKLSTLLAAQEEHQAVEYAASLRVHTAEQERASAVRQFQTVEREIQAILAAQERLIAEMKVWVQDGRETHPCDQYENFAGVCGHCDWSEISHDVWKWANDLSTLRGQA